MSHPTSADHMNMGLYILRSFRAEVAALAKTRDESLNGLVISLIKLGLDHKDELPAPTPRPATEARARQAEQAATIAAEVAKILAAQGFGPKA